MNRFHKKRLFLKKGSWHISLSSISKWRRQWISWGMGVWRVEDGWVRWKKNWSLALGIGGLAYWLADCLFVRSCIDDSMRRTDEFRPERAQHKDSFLDFPSELFLLEFVLQSLSRNPRSWKSRKIKFIQLQFLFQLFLCLTLPPKSKILMCYFIVALIWNFFLIPFHAYF